MLGALLRFITIEMKAFTDVGVAGFRGNVYRTIDGPEQNAQASRVIAVFVCDEHAVQTLHIFADEREPAANFFGAESGVNENTCIARNDQNRIAS